MSTVVSGSLYGLMDAVQCAASDLAEAAGGGCMSCEAKDRLAAVLPGVEYVG